MIDEDRLTAAVDAVARTGATQFELGYLEDDVPVEEARWWASARYQGVRIQVRRRR